MAYPENIVECILKLFPVAKNRIDFLCENSAEGLGITFWNLDDPEPTEAELNAVSVEIQAEDAALEYSRNRRNDYPDVREQFNKIYDDGITKWKAEMVDPIKTKWPKDNSGPVE